MSTTTKIDLDNLSSNWRTLQAKLNVGRATRPTRQRSVRPKRTDKDDAFRGTKRRRTEANSESSKRSSQSVGSRPSEPVHTAASLSAWALEHDIPQSSLVAAYGPSTNTLLSTTISNPATFPNAGISPDAGSLAGKYLAIDCEMVGIGPNPDKESALARASIVNYNGIQIYDSFVQTHEAVTDFRTKISGITPRLLASARPFAQVQRDIDSLIRGKVLIGHAIKHDLDVLMLGHPRRDIRDTSRHKAYRAFAGGRTPALKKLAKLLLGVEIQSGEHSSVEDARVTMALWRREKDVFEAEVLRKFGRVALQTGTKAKRGSAATSSSPNGQKMPQKQRQDDDDDDDEEEEEDTEEEEQWKQPPKRKVSKMSASRTIGKKSRG